MSKQSIPPGYPDNWKQDSFKTKMLFLLDSSNDVFAYMPDDYWYRDSSGAYTDLTGYEDCMRSCYAHVGQHSACSPEYAKECKEASKKQSMDLYQELTMIGYNIEILNKWRLI